MTRPGVMARILWRAGALLGTALLVGIATAAPVQAHAVLVSSNPVDGAQLDRAPGSLVLTFDEDVDVASTTVQLLDESGDVLSTGRPAGAEPGAGESTVVSAAFPVLAEGRYLLRWQTVTSDDFHPVNGALSFGVGVPVVAAGSSSDRAVGGPLETGARSLGFLGYMVAVGGLVLLVLLRPILARRPTAERTLVQGATLGAVLSLTGLVSLEAWLSIRSSTAPSSSFLVFWGTAVVSVMVLALASMLVSGDYVGRTGAAVAGGLGVVASVAGAWGLGHLGHGSTNAGSLLSTLHVVATAWWAGGLALLVTVAVPAQRQGSRAWVHVAILRFGRIAVPAVVVSVASGALLARGLVPSWEGLTGTTYGRALTTKLVLVALAILLGAVTALRARRRRPDTRISMRLMGELTAVVVVVLLAAALSGGQPPDDRRWAPTSQESATQGVHSAETADLVVTLAIAPNLPGANFTSVHVLDTRRPSPGPVDEVLVDLGDGTLTAAERQKAAPSPQQATDPGDDEWILAEQIDGSQSRVVRVVVRRTGWDDSVVLFPWKVAPSPGTELGGADLAGWWVLLAASALVGGAAIALTASRRLRRRGDSVDVDLREQMRVPIDVGAG